MHDIEYQRHKNVQPLRSTDLSPLHLCSVTRVALRPSDATAPVQ